MITCICIDDSDMPSDFPKPEKWIEEGEVFTIINIKFIELSEILGFQFAEINPEECYPYLFFSSHRFSIKQEDFEKFQKFMIECRGKEDSSADNFKLEDIL